MAVLAPYVATGWWKAVEAVAGMLEEWGRGDEAIVLARPHAEAGERSALGFVARLLARHGRADEAFTLLRPHVADAWLAGVLVDVAEAAGRDEDAAALLTARIDAPRSCDDRSCGRRRIEPFNAVGLLAAIRERQGRVEEAIALLHTRETTSVNGRDQLADLLARHDRIEELRAYAAVESLGTAAQCLAEVLEECGDVEGAIAVYRQPGRSGFGRNHGAVRLVELLVRHGRGEEATEVLRSLADAPGGEEDWIVDMLCTHYADQNRPEDGLAYLDALKERDGEEGWEFFRIRLPLLIACGRREEAIDLAMAHPERDTWAIAELLADAGRIEEAIALLEPDADVVGSVLAWHLIDLGRVKDAVAILQRPEPIPTKPPQVDDPTDEPRSETVSQQSAGRPAHENG
ncbi:hypothetical protein GCM10010182_00890 [Actinomadura cremea]|nr:hypothetical protein GCM10010182_00890 [Actinomadura cremea]